MPRRADGTPMVPGSGLLGAVRSVHEALAGGCLRVLDTSWVAVHRHPASLSETRDLQLAIVLAVDGKGRAAEVGLCDQEVWIDHELLSAGGTRICQTGDRLSIPAARAVDSAGRSVLRGPAVTPEELTRTGTMSTALDDSWVLLVTDTRARTLDKPVYFVAGRVGPGIPRCAIPPATWETYRQVVNGADDLRTANLPGGEEPAWGSCPPECRDVYWPPPDDDDPTDPPIGKRLAARHYLHLGQPVWVRVSGREVTELRLSRLWRYLGDYPVGNGPAARARALIRVTCAGHAGCSGQRTPLAAATTTSPGSVPTVGTCGWMTWSRQRNSSRSRGIWHRSPRRSQAPVSSTCITQGKQSALPVLTPGPLQPGDLSPTMAGGGLSGAASSTGGLRTRIRVFTHAARPALITPIARPVTAC